MQLLLSNPILNAYSGSDFFGKLIFLSLFVLSILTWILFLQKFLLQRQIKRKGNAFFAHFQKNCLTPLGLETTENSPFAGLYKTLKSHSLELLKKNRTILKAEGPVTLSNSDIDFVEAHLMSQIAKQKKRLEKNLYILSTIVSLAPFLGLLGTVWGILLTFAELQSGASISTNATMMGGLAMALGTTVLGLLVAIPALIGYNYLKAHIAQITSDMEDFSHLMLSSVELQYRQVDLR